jgi:hypothetical protein
MLELLVVEHFSVAFGHDDRYIASEARLNFAQNLPTIQMAGGWVTFVLLEKVQSENVLAEAIPERNRGYKFLMKLISLTHPRLYAFSHRA